MALRLLSGGDAAIGRTPASAPAAGAGALGYRLPNRDNTFETPFDLNLLGLWTLYLKEVRRFLKVWAQTMLAPVITTLIFLAIFALALHQTDKVIGGLTFLQFLGPA
jgi:hypothetical protein